MASRSDKDPEVEEKEKKQFEKDIEETFRLFDKNKDNSITTEEMAKVLRALGFQLSNKEVKQAMKQIDTNKNGKVEFGEFQSFMLKQWKQSRNNPDPEKIISVYVQNGKVEFGEFRSFMMKQWKQSRNNPDPEKEIRQAFRLFDRDGNGFIEKKELRIAMKSLGESLTESELDLMMKDADLNNDGKIDYGEFVRMWMQKTGATA